MRKDIAEERGAVCRASFGLSSLGELHLQVSLDTPTSGSLQV